MVRAYCMIFALVNFLPNLMAVTALLAVASLTAVCSFAAVGAVLPELLVETVLLLISDFFSIAIVLNPFVLNLDLNCVTQRHSAA